MVFCTDYKKETFLIVNQQVCILVTLAISYLFPVCNSQLSIFSQFIHPFWIDIEMIICSRWAYWWFSLYDFYELDNRRCISLELASSSQRYRIVCSANWLAHDLYSDVIVFTSNVIDPYSLFFSDYASCTAKYLLWDPSSVWKKTVTNILWYLPIYYHSNNVESKYYELQKILRRTLRILLVDGRLIEGRLQVQTHSIDNPQCFDSALNLIFVNAHEIISGTCFLLPFLTRRQPPRTSYRPSDRSRLGGVPNPSEQLNAKWRACNPIHQFCYSSVSWESFRG